MRRRISTLIVLIGGHQNLNEGLDRTAHIYGNQYQLPPTHTSHISITRQATYARLAYSTTLSRRASQHSVDAAMSYTDSSNMFHSIAGLGQPSIYSPLLINQTETAGTDAFSLSYTNFNYGIPRTASVTASGLSLLQPLDKVGYSQPNHGLATCQHTK